MPLLLVLTLPTLTGTGTGTSIYCTALYNILYICTVRHLLKLNIQALKFCTKQVI